MTTFVPKQLNYFKFSAVVLDEFPVAARRAFVDMWDNQVAPTPGFQKWDDSQRVRDMFLKNEGGKTKYVPTNKSYMEWDCTSMFEATLFARSFAIPDGKGGFGTLDELYAKPARRLSSGTFHPSVMNRHGNQTETYALALDQLRLLRNTLCHQTSTRGIDKATFDNYIQLAKDAVAALGQSITKIDDIGKLDENDFPTARCQQLKDELKKEKDAAMKSKQIENRLDQIGSQVNVVRSDIKDVKTKVNTEVTAVRRKVEELGLIIKETKANTEEIKQVMHAGSSSASLVLIWNPFYFPPLSGMENTAASFHNKGCELYKMGDNQSALEAFQAAVNMRLIVLREHKDTARSLNNLGSVQLRMSDFNGALKSLQKASQMNMKLSRHDRDSAANFNNLGCVYLEMYYETSAQYANQKAPDVCSNVAGDNEQEACCSQRPGTEERGMGYLNKAFEFLKEAANMYSRLNKEPLAISLEDQINAAATFHNLGCVYFKMGDNKSAFEAFQKAAAMRLSLLGGRTDTANSHHWLGVLQLRMGDHNGALKSLRKALQINEQLLRNHPNTAANLHNLGCVYMAMGENKSAVEVFQKAADIYSKLSGDHEHAASSLHNLGIVHLRMEKLDEALKSLQEAVRLNKKTFRGTPRHCDKSSFVRVCLF